MCLHLKVLPLARGVRSPFSEGAPGAGEDRKNTGDELGAALVPLGPARGVLDCEARCVRLLDGVDILSFVYRWQVSRGLQV